MLQINSLVLKLKENTFIKDSFWALIGNALAKGMALIGSIIVARFLTKDIYGEYGTLKYTVTNIAIFSTLGLGYTATKYIAEYKNTSPEKIGTIINYTLKISLTISALMAIIVFFCANYISFKILEAPHLSSSLRLVAIWIVFNALTTAQIGILSGFNAFKTMAHINLYVGICAFVSSIIFTYLWGLNGALIALLCTQILNWLLNLIEIRKYTCKHPITHNNKPLFKEVILFSLPVALQEGLYALSSWLMILLLLKLNNYGEVGLYSVAMQWSAVLLFIPGILRNVILTHLSGNTNNKQQHDKILKQTILINFISTFVPFIIIYFLKEWITSFYGDSFDENLESILSISLFTVIVISISNVYTQAYLSLNKNWLMLLLRTVRDFLIIVGTYFISTQNICYGVKALVIMSFLAQTLFLIVTSLLYHKYFARTKKEVSRT